jgi:hypothetical protein
VLKHPNGLVPAPFRVRRAFYLCSPFYRTARESVSPFYLVSSYLVTPVERVDALLSIADVREPVDVRYEGHPEDICSR